MSSSMSAAHLVVSLITVADLNEKTTATADAVVHLIFGCLNKLLHHHHFGALASATSH